MEVASLSASVVVDTGKVDPELSSLKATMDKLGASMIQMTASVSKLSTQFETLDSSTKKVKKSQDDAGASSGNLGRYMRELTTSMLGTNVIAITIGTTLGNMATQLATRVVLAVVDSVTQFAKLENQLAAVGNTSINVTKTFDLIKGTAKNSKASLKDLTDSYIGLAQQAFGTRVSIAETNKIFLEYQTNLAKLQKDTISGAFNQSLTAFGAAVAKLDNTLGVSSGLVTLLNALKDAFQWIADKLPDIKAKTADWQVELLRTKGLLRDYQVTLNALEATGLGKTSAAETTRKRIVDLRQQEVDLNTKLNSKQEENNTLTAEQRQSQLIYFKDTDRSLKQQIAAAREVPFEAELSNRHFALQNELRKQGIALNSEYAKQLSAQTTQLQYQSQIQAVRQFDLTNFQNYAQGQMTLLESLNLAYTSHAERVEAVQYRIRAAYGDNIQGQIQSATIGKQLQIQYEQQVKQTAQAVGNALVSVFPKSKAAAAAQAIINTAVGITEAYKLPFPLNWIQGAAILASGVAQLATIKSTNVGGGSPPTLGGSASGSGASGTELGTGGTPETPASKPQGSITIEGVDPAMIFTGDQLNQLIDRVNSQVRNGATLVSTRNIRG